MTEPRERERCGGSPGEPQIVGYEISDDPSVVDQNVLCSGCPDCTPAAVAEKGEERVSAKARESIRDAARKMAEARDVPDGEFPGHKGIFMANLEGYLGGYALGLLSALEGVEAEAEQLRGQWDQARDTANDAGAWLASTGPEGISQHEAHIVAAKIEAVLTPDTPEEKRDG